MRPVDRIVRSDRTRLQEGIMGDHVTQVQKTPSEPGVLGRS